MNLISIFIISFLIALSGALAPGPLLAVVIAETPRRGFKTGPLVIVGHGILETIMVVLLLLGLSKFLNTPFLIKITGTLGSVILFYFGVKLLITTPEIELSSPAKSSRNLPLLGITMSLANPYWTIWWLTIGLGLLLTAQKVGLIAILFFFLGHILADFTWYSLVSFSISRGKKLLTAKRYKILITLCGLTLISLGIYFGLSVKI